MTCFRSSFIFQLLSLGYRGPCFHHEIDGVGSMGCYAVLELTECINSLPSKPKMALASFPLCYTSKRYSSLTADPKCSVLPGFHFIGSFFPKYIPMS